MDMQPKTYKREVGSGLTLPEYKAPPLPELGSGSAITRWSPLNTIATTALRRRRQKDEEEQATSSPEQEEMAAPPPIGGEGEGMGSGFTGDPLGGSGVAGWRCNPPETAKSGVRKP
jgi:hypothetical protein